MATRMKISEFSTDQPDKWEAYEERLEQLFILEKIEDEAKKRATLITAIGDDCYALLRDLVSPKKPKDETYATLQKALRDYFAPKKKLIVERYNFYHRNQNEDVYCAMQQFQKRCTLMGSVYRGQRSASSAAASTAAAAAAASTAASIAEGPGSEQQQQQQIQRIRAAPVFSSNPGRALSLNIKEAAAAAGTASVATTTSNNYGDDPDDQADCCTDAGADDAELESCWPAFPISTGEIVRARVPPPLHTLPDDVDDDSNSDDPWPASVGADLVMPQQFDNSFYIDAVIVSSGSDQSPPLSPPPPQTCRADADSGRTTPSAGAESLEGDDVGAETVPVADDGDFYLSATEIEQIVAEQRRQRELAERRPDSPARAAGRWPGEDDDGPPGRSNAGFDFDGLFEDFESVDFAGAARTAANEFDEASGDSTRQSLNQKNNFNQEFDAFL